MKILFITPHLSTGGAPQYLLRKIQELNEEHDIYCVEYSNVTGGVLIVQRSQIENILGSKLITLNENKTELIKYIKKINPDIIHFEELPEYFCEKNVADKIYISNRNYKIIETSHDSSFNVEDKRYFPDRFIFVSKYQKQMFDILNIPSDIVEYPIVYKTKTDRENSLLELGLDPNKVHFLNVGLFTSRKNQAEIINYAKKLVGKNVQFHFVGNQADNFKWYWEPLMKEFPSNCMWWGERKDVDTFYNAMDIFLFTSKGTSTDKETNPLVIREAIGWQMPILMYNLPVYCGMYDKYKNINWLNSNVDDNLNIIKSYIPNLNEMFDISFDESSNKFNVTHNGKDEYKNVLFSIKDIDSKVCIYSCKWDSIGEYSKLWVMPLPKTVYDFKNNKDFSGFLFQIFKEHKELIFEKKFIFRKIDKIKPIFNFSDEDPIFLNYNEFFIDKIYDELNINNLNLCIDVGANVGLFTKYLKINGCKNILCFEPNISAFSKLKENLKDEVDLKFFNLAVSHNNTPLKLYINKDNSLVSSGCIKTDFSYEVNSITLNDIFNQNEISNVDLLKLDIEGMEFDLIENCDVSQFKKIKHFLIEYHDFYFENGTEKLEKLIDKLKNNGYIVKKPDKYKYIYATRPN